MGKKSSRRKTGTNEKSYNNINVTENHIHIYIYIFFFLIFHNLFALFRREKENKTTMRNMQNKGP